MFWRPRPDRTLEERDTRRIQEKIRKKKRRLRELKAKGKKVSQRRHLKRVELVTKLKKMEDKLHQAQWDLTNMVNIKAYSNLMKKTFGSKQVRSNYVLTTEAQLLRNMHQMFAMERQMKVTKETYKEVLRFLRDSAIKVRNEKARNEEGLLTVGASKQQFEDMCQEYEEKIRRQTIVLADLMNAELSGDVDEVIRVYNEHMQNNTFKTDEEERVDNEDRSGDGTKSDDLDSDATSSLGSEEAMENEDADEDAAAGDKKGFVFEIAIPNKEKKVIGPEDEEFSFGTPPQKEENDDSKPEAVVSPNKKVDDETGTGKTSESPSGPEGDVEPNEKVSEAKAGKESGGKEETETEATGKKMDDVAASIDDMAAEPVLQEEAGAPLENSAEKVANEEKVHSEDRADKPETNSEEAPTDPTEAAPNVEGERVAATDTPQEPGDNDKNEGETDSPSAEATAELGGKENLGAEDEPPPPAAESGPADTKGTTGEDAAAVETETAADSTKEPEESSEKDQDTGNASKEPPEPAVEPEPFPKDESSEAAEPEPTGNSTEAAEDTANDNAISEEKEVIKGDDNVAQSDSKPAEATTPDVAAAESETGEENTNPSAANPASEGADTAEKAADERNGEDLKTEASSKPVETAEDPEKNEKEDNETDEKPGGQEASATESATES